MGRRVTLGGASAHVAKAVVREMGHRLVGEGQRHALLVVGERLEQHDGAQAAGLRGPPVCFPKFEKNAGMALRRLSPRPVRLKRFGLLTSTYSLPTNRLASFVSLRNRSGCRVVCFA